MDRGAVSIVDPMRSPHPPHYRRALAEANRAFRSRRVRTPPDPLDLTALAVFTMVAIVWITLILLT